MKEIQISDLNISNRSKNGLHRNGINTTSELLNCTEESLRSIRHLGTKSVDEILEVIKSLKESNELNNSIYEEDINDFEKWLSNVNNQSKIINILKDYNTEVISLKNLSPKSYNALVLNGLTYLYQIAFKGKNELLKLPFINETIALDTCLSFNGYLLEHKNIFINKIKEIPIIEYVELPENKEIVSRYVRTNDVSIEEMLFSNRAYKRLKSSGYDKMSKLIFADLEQISSIPGMGASSITEIKEKVKQYIFSNEEFIRKAVAGDESVFYSPDFLAKKILGLYDDCPFDGFSFQDFVTKLCIREEKITEEFLKEQIGNLIGENKLEYVDYRCYRVYRRFEDVLKECPAIIERDRELIFKRYYDNETYEVIGTEINLSKQRVSQIVDRAVKSVLTWYKGSTGENYFAEDYFDYFYRTYTFDKKKIEDSKLLRYFELRKVKQGNKPLNLALKDVNNLDIGIRQRIKIKMNENRVYIDGEWIERSKYSLENYVVKRFCQENTYYDDFINIYTTFLLKQGIDDAELLGLEENRKARKRRIKESRIVLWKQGEQLRYYNVDDNDYEDLLEILDLERFENVKISTNLFFNENPEILKEYDIRDQYELHNLLRKTIKIENYPDLKFEKMPHLIFGEFDKKKVIMDILFEKKSLKTEELLDIMEDEYGFDRASVAAWGWSEFSKYHSKGRYTIEDKIMDLNRLNIFKENLTQDFYYKDEITNKYNEIFPDGDLGEVNDYNLNEMGFQVYGRYILQNYDTLEQYFEELLTKDELFNLAAYRRRYLYVVSFTNKLSELKKSRRIIEYDPEEYINLSRLERNGLTEDKIQDFCDKVYELVPDESYFTMESLRQEGFSTEIDMYGFSDWFHSNLLIGDDRFSINKIYGNLLLYKGNKNITKQSFIYDLVSRYKSIDLYDLINELTQIYGFNIKRRSDILTIIRDTEIFFDDIMERLYSDKEYYYDEINEFGGML